MCALTRQCLQGVTLLMDPKVPYGVTLAFTERTGGFSEGVYTSLNLGDRCGDDVSTVTRNRKLVLEVLGAQSYFSRLINPFQVHGDTVISLTSDTPEALQNAQQQARAGADGIVCTVENTPVLLAFADCVPIILVAPGGFAVVHSGWKGTIARIGARATRILCDATHTRPYELKAYIGPHIGPDDYEVSEELMQRFVLEFGSDVVNTAMGFRYLDLGYAVRSALVGAGIKEASIEEVAESTASTTERFFSYRAEGGHCGRHAAVAYMNLSNNIQK